METPPDGPPPLAVEMNPLPEPPRPINWPVFLAALFLPTLITVLSARPYGGLAAASAAFGGVASGIVCGILLGRRFGRTETARVFLSIALVGVMAVACVTMNFFGCAAAGFNLNMH